MEQILPIIIGTLALIIGIVLGKLIFAKNTKKLVEDAEKESQRIISESKSQAETLKKEKILEAKERFVQLKAEHDKEVLQRNQKLGEAENRIKQKEQQVNQKQIKVLIYNSQNTPNNIQALINKAKANHISVATITETLIPANASFQDWQTTQLQGIQAALAQATGK